MTIENYYSATEETILISRKDVTTVSDTVPNNILNIIWNLDLNALLKAAGIVAPRQTDNSEQVHKMNNGKYLYKLGTDEFSKEIEVSKTEVDNVVTLTYLTLTKSGANEVAAMGALSKRLKVNSDLTVSILAADANDVNSTLSIVSETVVSTKVTDSFDPTVLGHQGAAVTAFMRLLKKKTINNITNTKHWYNADNKNDRGVGVQVKGGLAQLFDKDKILNNLLGSSANAGVFLDLAKIETKMSDSAENDQFYTKMFSEKQLKEVLEAVYDKFDRIKYTAPTEIAPAKYEYEFVAEDSISCVVRVEDDDNKDAKNSDRWLITLRHKP